MTDHDQNRALGHRLAADARPLTPSFSESLHAATMQSLRRQHVRRALSRPENQWWRAGLAAAASLLVGASLWWANGHPEALDQIPRLALQGTPTMIGTPDPDALLRGARPLRDALAEVPTPLNEWGQDAESVVRYLRQQLPSAPPAAVRAPAANEKRM